MILCGTDLSTASEPATKCAAAVAKKRGQDLLLVTVLSRNDDAARRAAELRLEDDAKQLHHDFGISVETRVLHGDVCEQLLALSRSDNAGLLVIGAKGSSGHSRRLGSVPERLCQAGTVPVLIARNADGLEAWSRGARRLRVLLGSGLGDTSKAALRWVGNWSDLALTVAHIAWPFGEHYRLGVNGPMPLDHLRLEVHHQLLGDLGRWVSQTHGAHTADSVKLSVTPGWGRIDSHLALLAHEKEADLLVLGSHHRNLAERIWQGSISRNAIHEADCNVLCVPQSLGPVTVATAARVVVIATDFSCLADRALSVGYSLLDRGGTVHLVHVLSESEVEEQATIELQHRIPIDAESRGLTTVLHVLKHATPWLAIWQCAGRVNADLICMATHSRDGVRSLVVGSQAQELLQHSRVPVVLVPPDREG